VKVHGWTVTSVRRPSPSAAASAPAVVEQLLYVRPSAADGPPARPDAAPVRARESGPRPTLWRPRPCVADRTAGRRDSLHLINICYIKMTMVSRGTGAGRTRRRKPEQARALMLPFRTWGGARPGAGRKPNGKRAGVPHVGRQPFGRGQPLHITVRLREGLPSLRTRHAGRALFAAFAKAREHLGLRITHFSVQANHLHLLGEAPDRRTLSRAMQGLGIRIARCVNRVLVRRGSVLADRYHARALKTPLEVRRAILYVLNNYRRHLAQAGARAPWDWVDPFSSADHFDGFRPLSQTGIPPFSRPRAEFSLGRDPPVALARSWLLGTGWRRRGLIAVDECPGPKPPRR